jgi:hypothetical protein
LKQEVEEELFVSEHEGIELMGQGEDQVKGPYGKELSLLLLQPPCFGDGLAFWAVTVEAGVIGGVLKATAVTLLEMTPQPRGATILNGQHDPAVWRG